MFPKQDLEMLKFWWLEQFSVLGKSRGWFAIPFIIHLLIVGNDPSINQPSTEKRIDVCVYIYIHRYIDIYIYMCYIYITISAWRGLERVTLEPRRSCTGGQPVPASRQGTAILQDGGTPARQKRHGLNGEFSCEWCVVLKGKSTGNHGFYH